jgi:AcrR family transcriptional regulator
MESNQPDARPIWARPEPAARQPRFSRDQIAAAALAIADADGFEAVSMRRIAAALGAGTMSLYRYVATKSDLLALIDDALLGEAVVAGALPADWREALAVVARHTRQAYLRHPWAVQALQGRPAAQASLAGPNGLRHFEQSLAALDGAPLDVQAKLDLLAIVDDYVFGHLLHAAEIAERTASAAADSSAAEAVIDFVQAQLGTGEFPHLAALADDPQASSVADPERLTERFDRGLRLLIDGIAAGQP